MPAIAKFVTFDGGVAFSEKVMKFQNAGSEAVMIPLDEVVSVRVRRPQEENYGFIRVDTSDGERYRLFFEDDDLQDAVQFKKAFDATIEERFADDFDDFQEKETPPEPRPQRSARGKPKKNNTRFVAIIAIGVLVIGALLFITTRSRKAPQEQTADATPEVSSSSETQVKIPLDAQADAFVFGMDDPDENHRIISADEDTITFGFWVDGMASAVDAYLSPESDRKDSEESFLDDWNSIISSWVEVSKAELDILSVGGTPDAHLLVSLIDDRDQSAILFGIYDGEVVADVVNGIEP